MMTRQLVARCRGVTKYNKHNALGPDLLLIHAIHANEEEFRISVKVKDTGLYRDPL